MKFTFGKCQEKVCLHWLCMVLERLNQTELLTRLNKIVEKRLTDSDFGVEELAKAVAMSAPTLRRKIAESSKFTPSGFIQHCRLEKARQYSKEGKMCTLAELAHSVGFNQASYFSRLYRKTFNQWPLEKALQDKPSGVDSESRAGPA